MSSTELLDRQFLAEWPCRVCLPYDVDLLQLARWLSAALVFRNPSRFDIVAGSQAHVHFGSDPVDLFNEIQQRCVNFSLSHSYVVCEEPKSIMFFDMHSRFICFAANLSVVRELYPFSTEVMWEHFNLLQQEDDDMPLAETFYYVHSAR